MEDNRALEILNQMVAIGKLDDRSNRVLTWMQKHADEIDDDFFRFVNLMIEQYQNKDPKTAEFLKLVSKAVKLFLKHASGTQQGFPEKILKLLDSVQSGEIEMSKGLEIARTLILSTDEANRVLEYLERLAAKTPLPLAALTLAEILMEASGNLTIQIHKGTVLASCANILQLNNEKISLALKAYEMADSIFKTQGDIYNHAIVMINMSNAYNENFYNDTTIKTSIEFCKEALRIFNKEQNPGEFASAINNMGNAYRALSSGNSDRNLLEAVACFKEALTINTKTKNQKEYAKLMVNLAKAYSELTFNERIKHSSESIRCCMEAIDIFTSTKFPKEHADLMGIMGYILAYVPEPTRPLRTEEEITRHREEMLEWSEKCYNRALAFYSKDTFPDDYARIMNNLSILYFSCNNFSVGDRTENTFKSIECCKKALTVYNKNDSPLYFAKTMNNMGNAYRDLPWKDRKENFNNALACYDEAINTFDRLQIIFEIFNSNRNKVKLYFIEKDWEGVIGTAKDAIEIFNRYWAMAYLGEPMMKLSTMALDVSSMLSYALFRKKRWKESVEYLDKSTSLHLTETIRITSNIPDNVEGEERERLLILREEILILKGKTTDLANVKKYQQKIREFNELMEQYHPDTYSGLKSIALLLKRESVAVLYINITSHGGVAAIVTGSKNQDIELLPLDSLNSDFLTSFYSGERGWFTLYNNDELQKNIKQKLLDFIPIGFDKVFKRILNAGINRLVIIPYGKLHIFPFSGLLDFPDNFEVCFVPCSSALLHAYENKASSFMQGTHFTGFSNPAEDLDLRFADAEVAYINSLFKTDKCHGKPTIYWGRLGNKHTIYDSGEKSAFLHFSTHGYYSTKEIDDSYLELFENDKLYLKNIILDLRLFSCYLVSMCACETGIPDLNSPGEYLSPIALR